MCKHRYSKDGLYHCRLYDTPVLEETCRTCSVGGNDNLHIRNHPAAHHNPRPVSVEESRWLRDIGVPVPKRPRG